MSDNDNSTSDNTDVGQEFKKPMVIKKNSKKSSVAPEKSESIIEKEKNDNPETTSLAHTEVPYKTPSWSGLCPEGTNYALEVIKSGVIMEKIDLTSKPYHVFGRLSNCEIIMAHPTISRYHAILQYKALDNEDGQSPGWYIYDLGSTHGTFLNKQRVKDKTYTRVKVGHQIKFGLSTRTYIVLGPDFDAEGESDLSVTEIKKRAAEMVLERERILNESPAQGDRSIEEILWRKNIKEMVEVTQREAAMQQEKEKLKEEEGIDWGMGEDPEEEPDLAENPYASTTNEELYLQDPKKTLRGFFDREGIELEYDCVEKGVGQFACSVELPIDDAQGRPVVAEVIHRGKKKEAVVACALEACRILDRVGLLRQAKHESRRRKERDWSADDYYDSDEDTFFDRTGNVEKKRHARMEKLGVVTSQSSKPLGFKDLVEKIKELESNITKEEESIETLREEMKQIAQYRDHSEDYMKTIESIPNYHQTTEHKEMISKSKLKIKQMQTELNETRRLAEIARPTQLPELIANKVSSISMKKNNSVLYGKRMRLKDDMNKKTINKDTKQIKKQETQEFVEEVDSDDETNLPINTKEHRNIEERLSASLDVHEKTASSSMDDFNKETDLGAKNNSNEKLSIQQQDEDKVSKKTALNNDVKKEKKVYGPMRPPANYVIPDSYFDQASDRDLPEITENPEL